MRPGGLAPGRGAVLCLGDDPAHRVSLARVILSAVFEATTADMAQDQSVGHVHAAVTANAITSRLAISVDTAIGVLDGVAQISVVSGAYDR